MLIDTIYLQEERRYALERFVVVLLLTLVAFGLSVLPSRTIAPLMLKIGFLLLVVDIANVVYYILVSMRPEAFVSIRRFGILLFDIALLTYGMAIFKDVGIFLFGIYLVLMIRLGFSFGAAYLYAAYGTSLVGWFLLWNSVSYWHQNGEMLAAFALTALFVLLSIAGIVREHHQENIELEEIYKSDPIRSDAANDALTGLPTRHAYKETIQSLTQQKVPFVLLFISIDKTDQIAQEYGREIADEVIKEAVMRIKEQIEARDILIRMQGNELALIAPRETKYAGRYVNKLIRNVIGRHKIGKTIVPIELKVGAVRFPEDAQSAMMLGNYADAALFAAKEDNERYYYFYHELTHKQKEAYEQR